MAHINTRALLSFPAGDNSSDTIISGTHYNLTTLSYWNYTYYTNNTISNGSRCYLTFEPYTPRLLENGTFLNSTSCYSPIRPMQGRSKIGLLYAVFFSISIVLTLSNLRKHGRLFLPTEKRFLPVGRRWQWYWMLVVGAFGIISSVTNVDVDRYYLPELPLVLSSFFWCLMLPLTMCIVWESVRHWGSWQERQMIDDSSFMLSQEDLRSKVELCIPLLFYFFVVANILLVVPRSWSSIELQRDPEQAHLRAEPSATDIRFKLAAFIMFGAWLTTVFSLWHSIKHYKLQNKRAINVIFGSVKHIPAKFMLSLSLAFVMIGYEAACAFEFSISPLNIHAHLGMMYGLGWSTIALIFIVYEFAGYVDPNEDRELIRQRRQRNSAADREIGIRTIQKPHWWSSRHDDNQPIKIRNKTRKNVNKVVGGQTTQSVEMESMPSLKQDSRFKLAAGLLPSTRPTEELPANQSKVINSGRSEISTIGSSNWTATAGVSVRRESTSTTTTLRAQPQQIRSMLDV